MSDADTEIVEVPKALLERLLDRVDDLGDELAKYREENEQDKATIRQDVNEAIAKAEATTPTADTENDESAVQNESRTTPMHQLIQAGEAGVIGHVTASVRRAKAMAEHFTKWATKAPNGLVVRENLKSLLETATDEDLAWKQVYRAGRALAKFSKGTIAFKKTRRYGWILIAQPDDHRLRSLSANGG